MELSWRVRAAFVLTVLSASVAPAATAALTEADAIRIFLEQSPQARRVPLIAQSVGAALRVEARRHLGLEHPILDRLFELSELLVDVLGVEDVGARFEGRVAWHDACHPLRELGIRDQPRSLLAHVAGLELIELRPSDECCAFGGTLSVKHAETSAGRGRRKVESIHASGAGVVASTEASCLMQIDGLLRRGGSAVRTLHLAQILGGED
mgnify:CR=1 FL=1